MQQCSLGQKAHRPVTCQLCDEETKINWKCLDCDFLLCDRCNSIHSKVKTQLEHSVINLKDIGQLKTIRKPEAGLKVIRCETHKQQTYCVYCRDCEQLACPVCLSQNHKKHDLKEIRTVVKEKKLELKDYQQKYSTVLLQNDNRNSVFLERAVLQHHDKYEETKKKIKDQEQCMQNEVSRYINELIVDLDGRFKTTKLSISQEKQKLAERKSQIHEKYREIREFEKKTDTMEILNMTDSVKRHFQKLREDEKISIPLSYSKFVKGMSPESLKHIIGSIEEDNIFISGFE